MKQGMHIINILCIMAAILMMLFLNSRIFISVAKSLSQNVFLLLLLLNHCHSRKFFLSAYDSFFV